MVLYITLHNDMILKRYKFRKGFRPRIRLRYLETGFYCLGCNYYTSVNCSLFGEDCDPGRKTLPRICASDMKRWAHGDSKFIYHAV